MGGSSYDMAMGNGIVQYSLGYQSGRMCDIGHQYGTNTIRNFPESFKIHVPGIRRCPGNYQFWTFLKGNGLDFIVIQYPRFLLLSIKNGLIQPSGKIHRGTMCKMAAVGEIKA